MTLKSDASLLPRPVDAWLAAVAGCALAGLGIARLTLSLNPHLESSWADLFWLHFDFLFVYTAAGAVLGGFAAAALALLKRATSAEGPELPPGPPKGGLRRRLTVGWVVSVFLAPLAYFLLLPDFGWAPSYLSNFVGAGPARRAGMLLVFVVILLVAGWIVDAVLGLFRRRGAPWRLLFGAVAAGVAVLVCWQVPGSPRPTAVATVPEGPDLELAPPAEPPPPRLVLLCVDGADLDDVVEPMVAAGELPNFARMMEEGTWGPLATLNPTLSPVVWTTLATGKPPAEHGIHHFLHFRLPGVGQAIYEFPLHTGWNFELFPLLEKIPGMPVLRAPYTSDMRRVEALWQIVGRLYAVGSYRWLLSWPAEEVHGFSVAGGIGWAQLGLELDGKLREERAEHSVYPPGLRLMRPERRELTREEIEAFAGEDLDPGDPRLKPLKSTLSDPTSRELPLLIRKYDARFTAASFYPVDAYHHLFHAYRGRGGLFSGAIAEAYRLTDARLGELLDALDANTRVILVSDHGFDFANGHHTHGPAGLFFARGPGFDAGRRVEDLSVYDIAPMVLRLFEMPLPDDMPGVRSERYRQALSRDFLAGSEPLHIATYETARHGSNESVESPNADEIKDVLKSLGYIQ